MTRSLAAALSVVLLAVGTASVPANGGWANRCAVFHQLPFVMATTKQCMIDTDANHMIDVLFQAAARSDPLVADLHLPKKIGRMNASVVIRALAKASGFAASKDGKTLSRIHDPTIKGVWVPTSKNSRLPASAIKRRGTSTTDLDIDRCVPGLPASVSRATLVETDDDDEPMAQGEEAVRDEAMATAGRPAPPAKLPLTKPSTSEKPIDGKGSGFGTCARPITSRCVAEQDAIDGVVTLTQEHARGCSHFLKRVWHEKAYPSSHSMGMVNVCMYAARPPRSAALSLPLAASLSHVGHA